VLRKRNGETETNEMGKRAKTRAQEMKKEQRRQKHMQRAASM
jgi:hypothetical protein